MKKFLLIPAMSIVLILSLTACGSKDYNVTLADYENITISQAEIDEEIESIRTYFSEESTTVTEGTVADGDTVDISYVGTLDGVAFEGGTADNQALTIGSDQYIDGFEDGILGKEIGSTFDLNLTFPEDYSATDLAGQEVVFSVTVNAVTIPILPDYTDEWVVENSEEIVGEVVSTKEEFEQKVLEYLVLDKVFSGSTLEDYNQETYDAMLADQMSYYEDYAVENGMDLETLLSLYGTSEDDIGQSIIDQLKWQAIIFEIASLENINVDEEYESTLLSEATGAGYESTDEFIEGESIADWKLDTVKAQTLYPKVVEIIVSTSTITE